MALEMMTEDDNRAMIARDDSNDIKVSRTCSGMKTRDIIESHDSSDMIAETDTSSRR